MKQEKISRAYPSLLKLQEFNLPVKKAFAIYKLISATSSSYDFAIQEQKKYIVDFNGTIMEDGNISFATQEDIEGFRNKVDELYNIDVDLEITPTNLTEDDLGDQRLTASDISNLEGFVSFE